MRPESTLGATKPRFGVAIICGRLPHLYSSNHCHDAGLDLQVTVGLLKNSPFSLVATRRSALVLGSYWAESLRGIPGWPRTWCLEKMSESQLADTAAPFQAAVIDVLIRKAMLAVKQTGLSTVVLGGGVAANKTLRSALEAECQRRALGFFAAQPAYCTDNGAMIAALGYHLLEAGEIADLTLDAYPSS